MKERSWKKVCLAEDLLNNSGVCALLHEGEEIETQVALFQINDEQIFAINNYDPFGKAQVLYRGIVGSIGDCPVVASPLFKQHFFLHDGRCSEDESISVETFPIRVSNDYVEIQC